MQSQNVWLRVGACVTLQKSLSKSDCMTAHESMEKATRITIRTVQIQDISFLWDMLYEAAAVAEGMRALGREKALSLPVNRKYVEGWGRFGDAGVIASDKAGQPLGA